MKKIAALAAMTAVLTGFGISTASASTPGTVHPCGVKCRNVTQAPDGRLGRF